MLGELVDPLGPVFPLEESEAQGRPHEVLCWPKGGAMLLLFPCNTVCLGLRCKGGLQPHSHILGLFQWYLVLE